MGIDPALKAEAMRQLIMFGIALLAFGQWLIGNKIKGTHSDLQSMKQHAERCDRELAVANEKIDNLTRRLDRRRPQRRRGGAQWPEGKERRRSARKTPTNANNQHSGNEGESAEQTRRDDEPTESE